MIAKVFIPLLLLTLVGCSKKDETTQTNQNTESTNETVTLFEGEKHFKNVKQLTFGGQNAEAYFSYDGSELIFQSTRDTLECDVIFRMNTDGSR